MGRNGSGKSTIFEAVAFALYGSEAVGHRGGLPHVKRTSASPAEPCTVTLEFEHDGRIYTIERSVSRTRSKALLRISSKSGDIAQAEGRGVQKRAEKITGMNFKSFKVSVFARQKEVDMLGSLTPENRKREVLRLLEVDRIKDAIAEIGREHQHYENALQALAVKSEELDRKKDDFNRRLKGLEQDRRRLEEQRKMLVSLSEDLGKLDKEFEVQENMRDLHEKKSRELRSLQERLTFLRKNLRDLQKEIQGIENAEREREMLEPQIHRYHELKQRIKEMEKLRETAENRKLLTREKKQIENDLNRLQEKVNELRRNLDHDADVRLKEVSERIETHREEIKTMEIEREGLSQEIEQYTESLNDIETVKKTLREIGPGSRCPTCKQKLDDRHFHDLMKRYDEEIRDLRSKVARRMERAESLSRKIERLKKNMEALMRQEADLRRRLNAHLDVLARISDNEQEISRMMTMLSEVERKLRDMAHISFSQDEYDTVKMEIDSLEPLNQRYHRLKGISSLREQKMRDLDACSASIREAETTEKEIEVDLKNLGFVRETYEMVREMRDRKKDEVSSAKIMLGRLEESVRHQEKELSRVRVEIEVLEDELKQADKIKEEMTYLTELRRILNDFKDEMVKRIFDEVEEGTSYWLREITGGKYPEVRLNPEDWTLEVFDQVGFFPIGRFSGGERDLIGLCLRLAVSDAVARFAGSRPRFIVLDEIFGSQDVERRRNILDLLSHLRVRYDQVFLISHVEDIRSGEFLDSVMVVSERSDGTSEVRLEGTPISREVGASATESSYTSSISPERGDWREVWKFD